MQIGRALHHLAPVSEGAGFLDRRWFDAAMVRCQRLPLEREQAMALQISAAALRLFAQAGG